jgi:hypothetical protein
MQLAHTTTGPSLVAQPPVSFVGTDANVFIVLYGDAGHSAEAPLANSATNKNKFEKGQVDVRSSVRFLRSLCPMAAAGLRV